MESLPITLIVKAPNQQIEDQTIKCELSWTIIKLKQHLSEVYPSNPPHNEQKLIYSGQLLNDNLTLKDVLRQYDGQEVHTVHLVCSSKSMKPNISKPVCVPKPTSETSPNSLTENDNSTIQQPQIFQDNVAGEGNFNIPNMPWLNLSGQLPAPTDVNQYAMQLAWMQQAYIQYITQYMQLTSNSYQAVPAGTVPPGNTHAAPNPQLDPNQVEQPRPAAPPVPPQRDLDNPERDWLDMFYIMSRAMILFSVVYFYSSPLRFFLVMFLGFGLYLYQIGFFRHINYNNNNINRPPEQAEQEDAAPTRLMVVWTFFTTFFASLIPEIPNAF